MFFRKKSIHLSQKVSRFSRHASLSETYGATGRNLYVNPLFFMRNATWFFDSA
jgi:hypothetical protein